MTENELKKYYLETALMSCRNPDKTYLIVLESNGKLYRLEFEGNVDPYINDETRKSVMKFSVSEKKKNNMTTEEREKEMKESFEDEENWMMTQLPLRRRMALFNIWMINGLHL